jgi:ribonuclease P protein component
MRSHDVRRVLAEGRRSHGARLVLLRTPGTGATAVIAGRKVGGAVQRNRARRIMRAALREIRPRPDDDIVVVARPTIEGCATEDLVTEMTELLDA